MKIATEEIAVTLCVVDKVQQGPAIIEFMESPANSGGRLIIVCGLPGSGKTTHAKHLEAKLPAVRFCPDEWMDTLSLDLWDEARRQKIENLQVGIRSATARPSPDRNHRMGHLGKVGARRLAPAGARAWGCCRAALYLRFG